MSSKEGFEGIERDQFPRKSKTEFTSLDLLTPQKQRKRTRGGRVAMRRGFAESGDQVINSSGILFSISINWRN